MAQQQLLAQTSTVEEPQTIIDPVISVVNEASIQEPTSTVTIEEISSTGANTDPSEVSEVSQVSESGASESEVSQGASDPDFQTAEQPESEAIESEVPEATESPGEPVAVRSDLVEAKYHKFQVALFFGSAENPSWDNELTKTLESLDIPPETRSMMMNEIIKANGSKMMIPKKESKDDKDELLVLLQLHFCIERNLHRGTRTKSASISIGNLIGLRNQVSGNNVPAEEVDPFVEANNLDNQTLTEQQTQVQQQNQEALDSAQTQVIPKTSDEEKIEKLAELWNERPYKETGYMEGPIKNNVVAQMRQEPKHDLVGPMNSNDLFSQSTFNTDKPFKIIKKNPKNCKRLIML
jgi:hypothetical protein